MEYRVMPKGFAKIQLLSTEAMFGKNGIWHAKDEHELSAAIVAHRQALTEISRNPHVSSRVKEVLGHALGMAARGVPIQRDLAHDLVPMLNSAAFRTAGSSTMQWTVWKRGRQAGINVTPAPKRFKPISDLPQANVYVQVGNDLFNPLRRTTERVTKAVAGALDEARRRYPAAKVEELRELAAAVAKEGVFEPTWRKALMKVDYKIVRSPNGKNRAALIDVSSELVGIGATDELLRTYKLPAGLSTVLAHAFLNIHREEGGQAPKHVAIMVRDRHLATVMKRDIEALRQKLEHILRQKNQAAVVSVVIQSDVEKRATSIKRAEETRQIPFAGLKVADIDGRSVSPDLVIRYGRFPLSDEADKYLHAKGVKVLDKGDYVIAADKTVNAHVVNLLKLEKEQTVFVPRSHVSQHSIFPATSGQQVGFAQNEWGRDFDAVIERAKIEGWPGVVVKLPTKLASGQTGAEEVTAHFVNPHSPLQIAAAKRAIAQIRSRGQSLPELEKRKAKLTFEELVVSSLPELGGKGLEIRTLAMPRFKVAKVTKIVSSP